MIDRSELDTGEYPVPVADDEALREFSSRVRIDVAALSDKGRAREGNEDHFLVARGGRHIATLLTNIPENDVPSRFEETGYVMIVADGMGGHVGGEVASRMAIATLINIILHVPDWILRLDEEHAQRVMERAAERYRKVHEALQEKARLDPKLRGMGTTMTAAYSLGDDLFLAHVGDSRAYLFRDGRLQLLTHDQTQAQLMADIGMISQKEVGRHRLRHVLTNALGGMDKNVRVDLQRLKLHDRDRLLLCTDGLTDMVEETSIAKVLEDLPSSDAACQKLVNLALDNGGKDNVTVVLARYSIPEG
jgi:serine/threonine protein phosphatase PrpC